MKVKFMVISILVLISGILNANIIPGGLPNGEIPIMSNINQDQAKFVSASVLGDSLYTTTTYTFADIVVFSYFDSTEFEIFDNSGVKLDSIKLGMNDYHVFSPGSGTFTVQGTKSFTLLIGDPITNSVMGYFAVDEAGRPLSTNLNTYMPSYAFSGEHFIVFSYSDGTAFQITNLATGSVIASGILNEGEHYQLDGYNSTFINVTSNKPVSALSYTDQGYFIPSINGTFAGNEFYGFSGYVGSWGNGIVITAYNDSTTFLIKNSTTNDTIAIDTLNQGEVFSQAVYTDTYWKVTTSNNCTVCNTPYAAFGGSYYYLTRQMDETGMGIGTNFFTPVIPGDYNVFSYEDDNIVTIVDQTDTSLVWTDTLDYGENYHMSSGKKVYHVTGDKKITIISSYGGGFGADFMPLNFATGLPDLAISEEHIVFTPDSIENVGDNIIIDATVMNYGYQTAYNVECQFFDGDPSGGDLISTLLVTDSIPAGGSHTFSVDWIAPSNIKYHAVYVLVDPYDKIRESNSSNNLMFKYLIANDDLLPPFATGVEAPKSIHAYYGDTDSSQMDITVYIFNTGDIDAINSYGKINLPVGLSLAIPADTSVDFGTIGAKANLNHTWRVNIDSVYDYDAFFYSIEVGADTVENKLIERMIPIDNFTSVKDNKIQIPSKFGISQNYPNPFNPVTTIDFDLAENSLVNISVYNLRGEKVRTLVNENKNAGSYFVTFDGSNLSSGIYFYKILAGNHTDIKKMMLIK